MREALATRYAAGVATRREKTEYGYSTTGYRVSSTSYVDETGSTGFTLAHRVEFLTDEHSLTGYAQTLRETHFDGNGQLSKTVDYSYGQDELTQTTRAFDAAGSVTSQETLTFGHDAHGSVRLLTTLAGAVEQLFLYDAYGQMLAVFNVAADELKRASGGTAVVADVRQAKTTVQYSGERVDVFTGLQYLRARDYNLSVGQFNTLDPYAGNALSPVSYHKYLFGHADSVNNTDPTGMYVGTVTGIAVAGLAIGAATAFIHGAILGSRNGLASALSQGAAEAGWALVMGAVITSAFLLGSVVAPIATGVLGVMLLLFAGYGVYREVRSADDGYETAAAWVNVAGLVGGIFAAPRIGRALDKFSPVQAVEGMLQEASFALALLYDFGVQRLGSQLDSVAWELLTLVQQGCFPAGVPVATPTGPRPIESIAVDDLVWSFDLSSNEWKPKRVVEVFIHNFVGEFVTIECDTRAVTATGMHPFWVLAGEELQQRPIAEHLAVIKGHCIIAGRWVDARDLRIGDLLLLRSGEEVTVTGLLPKHRAETVYNFQVDELNTYAVGDAQFLVHNNEGDCGAYRLMQIEELLEKRVLSKRSLRTLYSSSRTEQHHIFTEKRKLEFKNRWGIDVDDWVVDIDRGLHEAFHSGKKALSNDAGWWDWELMFRIDNEQLLKGSALTADEVKQIGHDMLSFFQLEHYPLHKYNKPSEASPPLK